MASFLLLDYGFEMFVLIISALLLIRPIMALNRWRKEKIVHGWSTYFGELRGNFIDGVAILAFCFSIGIFGYSLVAPVYHYLRYGTAGDLVVFTVIGFFSGSGKCQTLDYAVLQACRPSSVYLTDWVGLEAISNKLFDCHILVLAPLIYCIVYGARRLASED